MQYIEKDFPIERLNEIARKEGNAKKPIYQIHKWWARRLGSVFRTILLTSFLPDDITEEEFWKDYFYKKSDLKDVLGYSPIILDPFMGGGTTIVEALRLGIKPIGIDINPVAWFVTKKEIEPLDLKKFDEEFKELERIVGEKIKSYYKTICPKCQIEKTERRYDWGEQETQIVDVMYVFWVNKVKCMSPYCGKDVLLYPSFKIATKKSKEGITHTVFCPECNHIFETNTDKETVKCPSCSHKFIPNQGYVSKGTYSCPHCGQKYKVLDSVRKSRKIPKREMYAIEYYCPVHGRGYKPVDEFDKELFEKARDEFEERKDELLFPRQEIPDGFNTKQMKNFGYKYFYEMFNERQLLCLSILLEEILKIEDENIREFMLLAFADSIAASNLFCIYRVPQRRLAHIYRDHHYAPPMTPLESNLWGGKIGERSVIKCVDKLKKGIEYRDNPYEKNSETQKKIYVKDNTIGKIVGNVEDLKYNRGNTILICSTSEDLSQISDKVDAIITDPPYYGNVMYSELADFSYVWLRIGLHKRYPWFASETTRNKREIIKNEVQNKDEDFFLKGIQRVYAECNRVLKDDGIFVFTFHHKETEAWAAMLIPILNSGLYVTSIYPIHSETMGGLRTIGKKAISYDTIIVCRKKKETPQEVSWNTLRGEIYHQTKDMIQRLRKTRPHLKNGDIFVIALGKGLEIYSKHHPNVLYKDGYLEPKEATLLMGNLVDTIIQEIKEAELPSGLDDVSRVYMGYLITEKYVGYDYLNKILRGRDIDIDQLENERLIEMGKRNEYGVNGPSKRISFIKEKIKEHKELTYIDKIHYLLYLYKRGDPVMKYISQWKDETLSLTLRIYCEKTNKDYCRKLYDIIEKQIAMKTPILELWSDES